MAYSYVTQKQNIFTERGAEILIKVRDQAKELIEIAGCFRMDKIFTAISGDTWLMMACVDWMVEAGELLEITSGNISGQHRAFAPAKSF